MTMKKSYLCIDDYDSGGIWYVVHAVSVSDIQAKLPFLTVVESRPEWMRESEYQSLMSTSSFDIDNLPSEGPLGISLIERLRQFEGKAPLLSHEKTAEMINNLLKRKHE